MPQLQYKFKSSIAYETINFANESMPVKQLKDLIFKKHKSKLAGFDLKMKLSNDRILTHDNELILPNSQVIVSRVPKQNKNINIVEKENPKISVDEKPLDPKPLETPNVELMSQKAIVTNENEHCEQVNKEINIKQKPPDYIFCNLCNKTMVDATEISCCKTSYCYSCISGYLFDPDVNGSLECPNCYSQTSELKENKELRKIIQNYNNGIEIPVELEKSPNVSKECEEKSIIESIEHVNTEANCENNVETNLCNMDDFEINEVILSNGDVSSSFSPPRYEYGDTLNHDILTNEQPILYTLDGLCSPFKNVNNSCQTVSLSSLSPPSDKFQQQPISDEPIISPPQEFCDEPINGDAERENETNRSTSTFQSDQRQETMSVDDKFDAESPPTLPNKESNPNPVSKPPINKVDFDPVLYMQFLSWISQNYPDELKLILSKTDTQDSISNKDEERKEKRKSSKSHRHRPSKSPTKTVSSNKSHRHNDINKHNENKEDPVYHSSHRRSRHHYNNTEIANIPRKRSISKELANSMRDVNRKRHRGSSNDNRRSRNIPNVSSRYNNNNHNHEKPFDNISYQNEHNNYYNHNSSNNNNYHRPRNNDYINNNNNHRHNGNYQRINKFR